MKERTLQMWTMAGFAVVLGAIVLLMIRPYGYNITSLFHMDTRTAEGNAMPPSFVIFQAPSYDGAQYYQVARNIQKILDPSAWDSLSETNPGSYAYQRFLLPLVAWIAALGNIAALPWAFLLLNITALLLSAFLVLQKHGAQGTIFAAALAFCPAAMVALHFTLAEPITILLLTAMLLEHRRTGRITRLGLVCLSLVVLAREVNILFIGFTGVWSLLTRRYRDACLMLVPATVFVAWHTVIYAIFGDIPFFMSTAAKQLPGSAVLDILIGAKGFNRLTVTSIALFGSFVVPGIIFTCRDIIQKRRADILSLGSLAFFGVMLTMPDYIWGSITSIGRVITPVYPLTILLLAERGGRFALLNATLITFLGIGTSIALALSTFPYSLTAAT